MNRYFSRLAEEFHKLHLTPEAKREALIFFRQLTIKIIGMIGAIILTILGGNALLNILFQKNMDQTLNFGEMVAANTGHLTNFRDFNVTQNVYPDTVTRRVIDEWDNRMSKSEENIEFTQRDIELLKKALADLDNRTSGLERLPDGRTKIGDIITGAPSVVLEEHQAAIKNFGNGKFQESLAHSRKAINAYESSKNISEGGALDSQNVAKLYLLAAMSTQNLKLNEDALRYALVATETHSTPFHKALLAVAYANLRKYKEALALLDEVISQDPSNEEWRSTKIQVEKWM